VLGPVRWHLGKQPAPPPTVPCYVLDVGRPGEPGSIDVPRGVALSRKGAKSPTGGRKLRSTETKAGTRVPQERGSITRLQQQLEARTRQLTRHSVTLTTRGRSLPMRASTSPQIMQGP